MNKKAIPSPNFTQAVIEELKRVSWPTKQETIRLTIVVILISLIIGAYIGIIDILLAKALELSTR
ncbi:MAG: preprotein translocase subunit SecE [Microgenomates group bacterium]